jgi:hypothetical protein
MNYIDRYYKQHQPSDRLSPKEAKESIVVTRPEMLPSVSSFLRSKNPSSENVYTTYGSKVDMELT